MNSNKIIDVKEHIGKSFTSEAIQITKDILKPFLESTGDTNLIHFDVQGAKKSVFAEMTSGEVVVPGFLTLSLCANEKTLYKALEISEPHEVISLGLTDIKFLNPVILNAKVVYEFKMKSVEERPIKTRPTVRVNWDIAVVVLEHERNLCMKANWTVAYISMIDYQ